MKSYQQFFAELKRRRVYRVMAAYGIIGFGIIEAAEAIFPRVALPDWAVTLVVWLTLLGFPIAVLLAWAFESTPGGMKRTEDAAPGEISDILAQPASKRWLPGLLALAGVALLFGGWWMGQRRAGPELNLSIPEVQAAGLATLAILPFENIGDDERNEVFASGLHMDLQQQLGQLSALRVTWPMSVREYRTSDQGDREIAGELGVTYLLRGSVRWSGDRALVDVMLVDAETGDNLWGDQYEGAVTPENLFEIQSGIALAVARRLATELSPDDLEALDRVPPTRDLAALAAYNRAREADSSADAAAQAERAVELDPAFVQAWAFLSRIRSTQAYFGDALPELAAEALGQTETLAPGSVEAITARAVYTSRVEQDWRRALRRLREAERIAPSDGVVAFLIADAHQHLGQWDEAIQSHRRAIAVNPRSLEVLADYAETLVSMGRMAASDDVWTRALQVEPSMPWVRAAKVYSTFNRYGDVDRARSLASELGLTMSEYREGSMLIELAWYGAEFNEAVRLAGELPRRQTTSGELGRLSRRVSAGLYRGDDVVALADSMLALDRSPTEDSWDEIIAFFVYASKGDMERAWPLLSEGIDIARGLDDHTILAMQLDNAATLYAEFGRPELAFELLDETVDQPGGFATLAYLLHSPDYRSLRGDPRFEAIVERRRAFEEQAARDAEAEPLW